MTYQLNVRCKFCDRFIPIEANASSNIRVRCNDRRCKQWNEVKVVMLSDHIKYGHTDCADCCDHTSHGSGCNHKDQADIIAKKDLEIEQKSKETLELQSKITEMTQYISSLEGIVDGQ